MKAVYSESDSLYRCECGYVAEEATLGPDAPVVCPGCGRSFDLSILSDDLPTQQIPPAAPPPEPLEPAPLQARPVPSRQRTVVKPDIPGYEIHNEIGRGGMGVVYRARHSSLNRIVALKMILAGSHATEAERERFRREAEAVARLQHPGIVQIYDIGEHDGQPFLALEYVEGASLAQSLARRSELMLAGTASSLVAQIARAVHYAHEQGIIHRDLKPANVLIPGGEIGRDRSDSPNPACLPSDLSTRTNAIPKITDFGLAKRLDDTNAGTRTGAVMGTPSYISPEQASGRSDLILPTTDVYSLGAILYELLTGRPPFKAATAVETVVQVVNDDPVPPSRLRPKLPKDLETICLKCLNKDPLKRYHTALELAEDIERFERGVPILARPLPVWSRAIKWARRHPAMTVFGAMLACLLLALQVVLSVSYARIADEKEQKEIEAAKANELRHKAELLSTDLKTALQDATGKTRELVQKTNELQQKTSELQKKDLWNARALYALQLAQVGSLISRDPVRAIGLLEDRERCPEAFRDFAWRYLRHQGNREVYQYREHRGQILAAAASPDGAIVATADQNGLIRLWSPITHITYAVLEGHVGRVNSVAFSPGGNSLVSTGDDRTVRIWDLPTTFLMLMRESNRMLPKFGIEIPPQIPSALFFTRLSPAVTIQAFQDRGRCVAFSPDGRTIAAGGSDRGGADADGVLRIYDLAGRGLSASIAAIAGVPVAAETYLTARTDPRKPVAERRTLKELHLKPIIAVAFSPDGQTVATGSEDASVQLTPVFGMAKSLLLTLHASEVYALAYSPDGRTLATVNNGLDPTVRLWDLTGRVPRLRTRLAGHIARIYTLAYSSDGQTIATSGFDRSIRLWDTETGEERTRLYGHTGPVRALAFIPDRKMIVSAGNDQTARIWQTAMPTADSMVLDTDRQVGFTTAAVSKGGQFIVTGESTGQTRLWARRDVSGSGPNAAEWTLAATFGQMLDSRGQIRSVAISDSGRLIASASDVGLLLWDMRLRQPGVVGLTGHTVPPQVLATGRPIYSVTISGDGQYVAAADEKGVWLWETATGKRTSEQPIFASANVREVEFAPSPRGGAGTGLLSVITDRSLVLVDLRHGNAAVTGPSEFKSGQYSITFAPDGSAIATGSDQGEIAIWDLGRENGQLKLTHRITMTGHADAVSDLKFTHDGRTLLSSGHDRSIILWDPLTGQERLSLSGHTDRILKMCLMPRDAGVLSVGRDGTLKYWYAGQRAR